VKEYVCNVCHHVGEASRPPLSVKIKIYSFLIVVFALIISSYILPWYFAILITLLIGTLVYILNEDKGLKAPICSACGHPLLVETKPRAKNSSF